MVTWDDPPGKGRSDNELSLNPAVRAGPFATFDPFFVLAGTRLGA